MSRLTRVIAPLLARAGLDVRAIRGVDGQARELIITNPRQRLSRPPRQHAAAARSRARADEGDQMTHTTRVTNDPRLYVRITEDLRHKISGGTIKANVSITDLSQQWGASRQTVSKALRALEDDGLIRRYPGVGYYVLARSE